MDRGLRRGGRERSPGRLPAGRAVRGLPDGRAQRGGPWKSVQQPCGCAAVRLTPAGRAEWKGPSGLALGRAGAVQRPFLIAQTASAVRMTSAAMGCTAGARQTAMTAISQMIGPPRGPFPESRISAPFRWAAPRLARQRRPAVAGRSLSTRANGRRSTGTMVSANMESAGWRRANFFPFSRRCATTSSGRWPRPVGCP